MADSEEEEEETVAVADSEEEETVAVADSEEEEMVQFSLQIRTRNLSCKCPGMLRRRGYRR